MVVDRQFRRRGGAFRRGRTALLGLSGALLLTIALSGCEEASEQTGEAQVPPPSVVVAAAVPREVAETADFVGRVDAYREVEIRARVRGFLLDSPFEEGTRVEKDQLLFVIDPAEFEAARDAAAAELERAEATAKAAEKEVERARTLIKRGNISQSVLDEREADASRSKADVSAAKASLRQAELELGYTEIRSPIAGRIGARAFDVGNLIDPESGVLATVVAIDPVHVNFPISERDLLDYMQNRLGTEGPGEEPTPLLRLTNGDVYKEKGRFEFLDNRVDPTTGTIKLHAVFPNPDRLLLPGQFVTVVLRESAPESRVVVPQAAVQANQAGHFLLVVGEDNRAEARPVVMGPRDGADWVVREGLSEGEVVIVEGLQKVRPGAAVQPVRAEGEGQ